MPFLTPKTDWLKTDRYSVADWERVRNNLIWCNNWLIQNHRPHATLHDVALDRGTCSLPTVELVNKLEQNLQRLYDTVGINFADWRDSKTWYAILSEQYTANPTYDDWNRWEQLAKDIKNAIDLAEEYVNQRICGTFYAGSHYRLQLFSRGR